MRRLSRRGFFKASGVVAAGSAATVLAPAPLKAAESRSFSRVVDLTHTMGPDFPTFSGASNLDFETVTTMEKDGYFMQRWLLVEHTGTHMDAPIHFSPDGRPADEIPVDQLVVPLAVVDITGRAAEDPDAQVTPDDLAAWVAEHGPVPDGACVAMNSGWDRRATSDSFRNVDDDGFHFPGFHVEAIEMLMEDTTAVGIAVDTLSLDYGQSRDFATHYRWLPSNRWGLEAVANLGELPPVGATLVVGSPKIRGATGGPSRIFALV